MIPESVLEKSDPALVDYCKQLEERVKLLEQFQDHHYNRLWELLLPYRENYKLSDDLDIEAQELDSLESHRFSQGKVRRFRLVASKQEMNDIHDLLSSVFISEPVILFEVLDVNEKSDFVNWAESNICKN